MYDATSLLYGFRYNNVDYYYDRDILGNINHIILANGQVVVTYRYDAYGVHQVYDGSGTLVTNNNFIGNINPFRYKGYYYDVETGLYYLKTRYYNPLWGRFISPDNVKYLKPDSINGLNLYAYCDNDPINKIDPSGCLPGWAIALIVAAAVLIFCKSDSENINYKYDEDYEDDEVQRIANNISELTCSDGTIIYYKITKSNDVDKSSIKIINSYLYTKKQICELLDYISETEKVYLNYELILNEWKWHSLAYGIGFSRDSTASVDVYFNSEDTGHGIFSWIINNWFI